MAVEGFRAGIGVDPPDQLRKVYGALVVDLDLDSFHESSSWVCADCRGSGYEGLEPPEHGVTVIDDPMDFPVLVGEMLRRTVFA